MIEQIKQILAADISEVIKTPELSLSLLSCYSVLYLNGAAPRVCEKSQKKYYERLRIDGMTKATKKEKGRSAVPAWKGRKYVAAMCVHLDDRRVTDEECIRGLIQGHLTEKDFKTLPAGLGDAKAAASAAEKVIMEAQDKAKAKAAEDAAEIVKRDAESRLEAEGSLKKAYASDVLATLQALDKVDSNLLKKLVIDLGLSDGKAVKAELVKALEGFRNPEDSIL